MRNLFGKEGIKLLRRTPRCVERAISTRTHRAAVVIIVRAIVGALFGTVIAITLTRTNTAGTSSAQHRHRRNQTGKMHKGVALNTDT